MQIIPEKVTVTPEPDFGLDKLFTTITTSDKNPNEEGFLYWYTDDVRTCTMDIHFTKDLSVGFKVKNIRVICRNSVGDEGVARITLKGNLQGSNKEVTILYDHDLAVPYDTNIDITIPVNSNDPIVNMVAEITFMDGNGGGGSNILSFIIDAIPVSNVKYVSGTGAYHGQTVSMNTTEKILAKKLDKRLGLLGVANDGDNFGSMYVVGYDGRAHLIKSGIKSKTIFEGKVDDGTLILGDNASNFKYLQIITGNTTTDCESVVTIPIKLTTNYLHNGMKFNLKDYTTVEILENTSEEIRCIIGIY